MTTPTSASIWFNVSGRSIDDDLLEWVPDVFALTDTLLQRSEAYRFAVSPPDRSRWPPPDIPGWKDDVARAAEEWGAWAVDRRGKFPPLVAEQWTLVRDGAETALEDIASGRAWQLCQALLTLHAVADEACAGMGVDVPTAHGGRRHRARATELLACTGSLARIPRDRLRVLPKVRTPAGGISFRALSRYVCVRGPDVDVNWHRTPVFGAPTTLQHANVLLLPWPLRIGAHDFKPVPGSVRRLEDEPFGFFSFLPAEEFDVDLVDQVLTAAGEKVDAVDVVVLPESAVPSSAISDLQAVLRRHGVDVLIAGVREVVGESTEPPANWVQLSVFLGGQWWHYRQNKHHRWFLDSRQIDRYQLAEALRPTVRWWEAMAVPRRSVQFIELGSGVALVAVVCEDLARLDEVADLLRAVGPTLVTTILLDGPQLASRWTARYGSILADDPGSAVLTLTSYGLVQRSRRRGQPVAPVVALWKDATQRLREIALEAGAQGVVVTVEGDQARRRAADGRMPVDNVTELVATGVHQIRAATRSSAHPAQRARPARAAVALRAAELTILASWSDAVAETIAVTPGELDVVLADAAPGAPWRAPLGAPEPSPMVATALASLTSLARMPDGDTSPSALKSLNAARAATSSEDELTSLVATLLSASLESRLTALPPDQAWSTCERPPAT